MNAPSLATYNGSRVVSKNSRNNNSVVSLNLKAKPSASSVKTPGKPLFPGITLPFTAFSVTILKVIASFSTSVTKFCISKFNGVSSVNTIGSAKLVTSHTGASLIILTLTVIFCSSNNPARSVTLKVTFSCPE